MARSATPKLRPEERAAGLARVWSEVTYNYPMWHRHADLNWDAAFQERLTGVLAARSDWEYYRLLQSLAARVKDSHVRVWMPDRLRETRSAPPVALWPEGEQYVVIGCATGLGVAVGDVVVAVDGVGVEEYAATQVAPYTASPTPHCLAVQVAWSLLEGRRGRAVDVRFGRPGGEEYGCHLARRPARKGTKWVRYAPLAPDDPVTARLVAPGIGLIAIRTFSYDRVVDDFDRELAQLGPLEGLILDLRTNGGGNSGWSDQIACRFLSKPLAGMRERRAHYCAALRSWGLGEKGSGVEWEETCMDPLRPAGPAPFHGRLVLLTSAATHSAAEDFVGPLKVGGRALTVGATTAGSTGNPLRFDLPGGGGLTVCTRYMQLPDGSEFIGLGIPPDVPVQTTAEDIAVGRDPCLDRALVEIERAPTAD
jgi:carboxyl-terminal processing protease